MGFLHGLYRVFSKRPDSAFLMFLVDAFTLAGAVIGTVYIRRAVTGYQYGMGADVLMGFLIGLTIVACFNAIIYLGSFGYNPTKKDGK